MYYNNIIIVAYIIAIPFLWSISIIVINFIMHDQFVICEEYSIPRCLELHKPIT